MDWNALKNKITLPNLGVALLTGAAVVGFVSTIGRPTKAQRVRSNILGNFKSEQGYSLDLNSQLVDDYFLAWALSNHPEILHEIIIHYEDLDNGTVMIYVDDEDEPRLDDLLLGYEEELANSLAIEDTNIEDDVHTLPEWGWDDHLGWEYASEGYYPGTDIEYYGKTGATMDWFREKQPWHFADIELTPTQIDRRTDTFKSSQHKW